MAAADDDFPTVGASVVVWHEVTPSRQPREPHETAVDHVGPKTFTVTGLDAVFNSSTGRSKPVRNAAGAFGSRTYLAVSRDSDRGRDVLGEHRRRDLEQTAVAAVDAWRAERTGKRLRALIEAAQALEDTDGS